MMTRPAGGWKRTYSTPPGEMLLEEFMKPFGLTTNGLAAALRIPASRIHDIVHGRRGITSDTAVRLSVYFGNSAEFWLNLQGAYDLVESERKLKAVLKQITPLAQAS